MYRAHPDAAMTSWAAQVDACAERLPILLQMAQCMLSDRDAETMASLRHRLSHLQRERHWTERIRFYICHHIDIEIASLIDRPRRRHDTDARTT